MANSPSICWFRLDLRLDDHPALLAAIAEGGPVIPLFIWSPEEEGDWSPGAASRWWLHQSLASFDAELRKLGSRLIIRRGPALAAIQAVIAETGTTSIFWSCRYEPAIRQRGGKIETELRAAGVKVRYFPSALLFDPATIRTNTGKPFQVFTPYWQACLRQTEPAEPLAAPSRLPAPPTWPSSVPLDELQLQPKIDWTAGMQSVWEPGIHGTGKTLHRFAELSIGDYDTARDRPDQIGTSRLSPHLHFGEISVRRIWHTVKQAAGGKPGGPIPLAAEPFLRELGWREFAHYLLTHFPQTQDEPLRENFTHFPWEKNVAALRSWQRGQTGYPLVDAGMRELWTTGWMHNRVRMVVASFLVKHLLVSWREGAVGFGTRWSMPIWRTTRSAGNGPPAAEPMPRRSSAFSIRSHRERNSTQPGITCGVGFRKSPCWTTLGFMHLGKRRR